MFWDDADGEVLADLDEDECGPPEDDDDDGEDGAELAEALGQQGGEGGEAEPDVPDMAWQRLIGHTEPVRPLACAPLTTARGLPPALEWSAPLPSLRPAGVLTRATSGL